MALLYDIIDWYPTCYEEAKESKVQKGAMIQQHGSIIKIFFEYRDNTEKGGELLLINFIN